MEWWVFPALVLCAVTFTAAAGVLVFLAGRGVWRLLARYEPTHALAPSGERWVPWDTDPRFGSMQLDADRALTAYELGIPVEPDMAWREMVALGEEIGDAPLWPAPPRDWREVAHEEDWRDQTAADLAPAALDSGPGGPSLAPGPDLDVASPWAPAQEEPVQDARVPGEATLERTVAGRLVETSDEWLRRLVADARKVLVPADELPGDWPGWTWAGTVAA